MNTTFIEPLKDVLKKRKIVSISGPSGSGKSTLAMQILVNLFRKEQGKDVDPSCIWIQASEAFSKKRFEALNNAFSPKKKEILKRIFVLPSSNPCHDLIEQQVVLNKISDPSSILPPDILVVVIDNISHHLRYEVSNSDDVSTSIKKMNTFFEHQLLPLIMACQRNKIVLVLIHEITFVPQLNQERPFFYKLYDRIDCINIKLAIDNKSAKKRFLMTCKANDFEKDYYYRIGDAGLLLELI